jgi:prephenate dehydrogenase
MVQSLAIIGVGLIGGSIGLAARRAGTFGPIIGVGRDPAALAQARTRGCIDEFTTDLAKAASRADILVFCTPVDLIARQILAAVPHCKPTALITDAGSTKAAIVADVEKGIPAGVQFIGSHPLAGSEKRGSEHARADLFDDRLTLITPTRRTAPQTVERATEFWAALGSRVKCISPEKHDEGLALTSHLPHLVAAALAGILPSELGELTATGFRDTTRLAGGDPNLWTAIFAQNGRNVAAALGTLLQRLIEFESALLAGEAGTLDRLLDEGKRVRDDLGN